MSCILLFTSSLKAQEIASTPTLTPKTDSLPKKIKEFGIGFTSLTAYSLQYRWGNTKRLFRVNANISGSTSFGNGTNGNGNTNINGSSNSWGSTTTNSPLNCNVSLSFSMLNLKQLVKKVGLIYGPVAGLSYSTVTTHSTVISNSSSSNNGFTNTTTTNNTTTDIQSQTLQPYIGFVLGAFYKINKSFFLYAEIAPNIYYAYNYNNNHSSGSTTNSSTQFTGSSSSTFNNTFGLANLSNSGATITIVYRITGK